MHERIFKVCSTRRTEVLGAERWMWHGGTFFFCEPPKKNKSSLSSFAHGFVESEALRILRRVFAERVSPKLHDSWVLFDRSRVGHKCVE